MPLSLLLFSSFLHAYVGIRLVPALGGWPVAQLLLGLVLLASTVLTPLGLTARRFKSQPLSDRLAWTGLLAMGLFSSLFVLTLLRDAALLAGLAVLAVASAAFSLDATARGSAAAVPLAGLFMSLVGFVNARRTATVVQVDVPITGLPAALHGFAIAQISDIHVGPTIKHGYLQAIVRAVNTLQVDMVAVTGDLVDGTVAELAHHVAPLAGLTSTHGTYFVTGNHEYYNDDPLAWLAWIRRLGFTVLLNEHRIVERNGARLVLSCGLKAPPAFDRPVPSFNLKTRKQADFHPVRHDITSVPAAAVIAEAVAAFVIADALLEKFGGDSLGEIKPRVEAWRRRSISSLIIASLPI